MSRITRILVFGALCLLAISSCTPPAEPAADGTMGAVRLTILDGVSRARTLDPGIGMEVERFSISGTGPHDLTFATDLEWVSDYEGTTTINDLWIGDWAITVTGYNNDESPLPIGEGTETVTIVVNTTVDAYVEVGPLVGNGTLDLTIELPEVAADWSIEGALVPTSGGTVDMSIDVVDGTGEYYSEEIPGGFYTMSLTIYDGETVAGRLVHAVCIVSEQTTRGTVTLSHASGAVSVEIGFQMPTFVLITLSYGEGQTEWPYWLDIENYGSLTVYAQTDPEEGEYTYQWYVDGVAIPNATYPSLFISEESESEPLFSFLDVGTYTFTVIVQNGEALASASGDVVVVYQPVG